MARDERLAGFAWAEEWAGCLPGPELATVLAAVAGEEWRCPGAEPDELIGVLRRITALESWASAGKLAVIREMMRRDDLSSRSGPRHGDLPDQWSDSLTHELALALAASVGSAQLIALTAWELGARLPGIAALLADGTLTYAKAKLIAETFQMLSDPAAARAEALIIPQLTSGTGKTYGQILNLANRIAVEVDPGLAERRRKAAVKHASRVQMYREQSGAAALCGRDLPLDETLAADAKVTARAAEYKASGAFPGVRMDQFRSAAYLDLINSTSASARIAMGYLTAESEDPDAVPASTTSTSQPSAPNAGSSDSPNGPPDDGEPDDGGPDDGGAGFGRPGGGAGGPMPPGSQGHPGVRPVLTNLVLPLATLPGLAERPGEAHGLGVLDPDLCRDLAALAAASPHSQFCITVTDPDGIAIGHGCGRPGKPPGTPPRDVRTGAPPPLGTTLPARVNLTITADRLSAMLSGGPGSPEHLGQPPSTDWALTWTGIAGQRGTRSSTDDPDWCGAWVLTLPGGRQLAAHIEPVPTYSCDHRRASRGYQPSDTLRHLVQVRDATCTFPVCNRHARESDFEHAIPYHLGGRTDACNAGARSRACHRVKQSRNWRVTQPRPGWHVWRTPSGRTYTQAPYQYPV